MATARKGTIRNRDLWERLVNSHFGSDQPVLSADESIKAAKKLYRTAMGHTWTGPVKLTAGRRYTWVRRGTLYVNPDMRQGSVRGLRAIIHDLSHYAHSRLHPKDAPHSRRQAQLESRLVKAALRRGFADGKLASKPKEAPAPKPPVDKVQQRYARMVARRDKWEAQRDRAERLLAKAAREVREYERRHAGRLAK